MTGPSSSFNSHVQPDQLLSLLQTAHGAITASDHHKYKVGSSLLSILPDGQRIVRSSANVIPQILKDAGFTSHTPVGDGSPTVHGEFMLLKDAPHNAKNHLACNICFCTTCVHKSVIAEVEGLIYDARAFDDPVIEERFGHGWRNLCLPLMRAAQIPLLTFNPETGESNTILAGLPPGQRPRLRSFLINEPVREKMTSGKLLGMALNIAKVEKYPVALAIAYNRQTGAPWIIGAALTSPPGMSLEEYCELQATFLEHRYSPSICPIKQLTIGAVKHNLTLEDGMIATSYLPKSSRQLDMIACGVRQITVPVGAAVRAQKHRSESFEGLRVLSSIKALQYRVMENSESSVHTSLRYDGSAYTLDV